mgnify:CR=1 FL=1
MRNTLSTFSFYRLFIGQFLVGAWIFLLGYSIFFGDSGSIWQRTLYIIDTSLSMGIEDVDKGINGQLQSRLDQAKSLILSSSFSWEVAVIAYARSPGLILPFTSSLEIFTRTIQNISTSSAFGGSDPVWALSLMDTLYKNNTTPLNLFLLTDGWNTHSVDALPPLPSLSHLTIIGLGSDAWWKIPLGYDSTGARRYKIYENQEVIVPFDETFLQKIKKEYSATYVRMENGGNKSIPKNQVFSSSFYFRDKILFIFGCMFLIFWYFLQPYRTNLWKK